MICLDSQSNEQNSGFFLHSVLTPFWIINLIFIPGNSMSKKRQNKNKNNYFIYRITDYSLTSSFRWSNVICVKYFSQLKHNKFVTFMCGWLFVFFWPFDFCVYGKKQAIGQPNSSVFRKKQTLTLSKKCFFF